MENERFKKFTPNDSLENSNYDEAFDYIFQKGNEDIRNVGIMGVYGSGKSSIVRSYENKKKLHFLYISVADFSKCSEIETNNSAIKEDDGIQSNNIDTEGNESEPSNKEIIKFVHKVEEHEKNVGKKSTRSTNEIESEIINVLLHKISSDKINQTRFPIKKKIKNGKLFWKTVCLLYCLLYFLLIIKPTINPMSLS